jgi:hypothetical protein
VVLGEDGEGLLGGARVVAALGGLDGFAGFDGWGRVSCCVVGGGRGDLRAQLGAEG